MLSIRETLFAVATAAIIVGVLVFGGRADAQERQVTVNPNMVMYIAGENSTAESLCVVERMEFGEYGQCWRLADIQKYLAEEGVNFIMGPAHNEGQGI